MGIKSETDIQMVNFHFCHAPFTFLVNSKIHQRCHASHPVVIHDKMVLVLSPLNELEAEQVSLFISHPVFQPALT